MLPDEKEIFKGLGSSLLQPGEEAQFQWLRDGQPFDPEERFKVLFKVSDNRQGNSEGHFSVEYSAIPSCIGTDM